ncbi:MAG: GNAT family N-acetyltransferase [Hyphomicrobium sp.]|uniref:GNAT family N-acetyltransferase n=1 Tax=Hyphomicrobium sp. TaxID=82 RepID=UPI003D0FD599
MCGRIRHATIADALEVAAIIDIAGHGIDLELWMQSRDSDHSVLAAARRVVLEDPTWVYHYSRAHVLEMDGRIAGGLIGGLVDGEATLEEPLPPHLEPLVALENRVPGYWNLLALAVHAEFRGKGLASRLLGHAAHLASQSGARGLSIVVEDTNTTAIALYRKKGFEEVESQPWVAYGERTGPRRWLMLAKSV